MLDYLMRKYGFNEKTSTHIVKEYELFITATKCNIDINDFVSAINGACEDLMASMNRLGVASSIAEKALKNTILAMKNIRAYKHKNKQWQPPYKYHR